MRTIQKLNHYSDNMPRQDSYNTYGSVPNVRNEGVSGAHVSVKASPEDFGSQVGGAIAEAGKQVQDISSHFLQVASEAKVNDDYANKYVPAAANLRAQYDNLRGQDKIPGYDSYINGLQTLNKQFTESQPGTFGQKAMASAINRHISGEVFGAKRELVASQQQFADQSTYDMIAANNKSAAMNYDNPELVNSYEQQNNNHIVKQFIDNGHDPNHPVAQSLISDAQQGATGDMAVGMIDAAVKTGDTQAANGFRSRYASVIPGYKQLAIDNVLHTQNIKQTSDNTVNALTIGAPIPEPIGAPAVRVQALVANTAKTSQVDPNHALTVLRIESANGQNVGVRGTLGQDKESAEKPLEDQAKTLCDNLKAANIRATEVLGRESSPWEGYVVYQQGAGGGAALLKAAQEDPNKKAIEVLSGLYNNPKDALSAVNGNGGNSTMSVADFIDHIKQVYNDNAKRANCDFGDRNPGKAIIAPHEKVGVTVQPAASPIQAQINFEKKIPDIMSQINSIPNYEVRAGVMKSFTQDRQRYQATSTAYKNVLLNEAGQLAVKPEFTSMDLVPPDMMSALLSDSPQTITFLEARAEHNLHKQSGNVTKDMREYGNGFYDLFKAIHTDADDPSKINSMDQIQKHVGKDGDITIAGYDRLVKELQGKNTPEGESEGIMKKQFLANAKQQISGKDEALGIRDPKGEELYLKFLAQTLPAYEAGRSKGLPAASLLDPNSKDYIGNNITTFKRPMAQMMADMAHAPEEINPIKTENEIAKTPPIKFFGKVTEDINTVIERLNHARNGTTPSIDIDSLEGLQQAVAKGNMTREAAIAEAHKKGFLKTNLTPLAQ